MGILQQLLARLGRAKQPSTELPGERGRGWNELGFRPTPDNRLKYAWLRNIPDSDLRARIRDIRAMDEADPRVKKIHSLTADHAVKGGLRLETASSNREILAEWREFHRRLELSSHQKLKSHMAKLLREGNLALQWVLDGTGSVAACVAMPMETIVPSVDTSGRFVDAKRAYVQIDEHGGENAVFPLWQLTLVRLAPENHDDYGSLGRPYLDSARKSWKQLVMEEDDMVLRRAMRAPLRMAHVLEGATKEQLEEYRAGVEDSQRDGVQTDYYLNRKGGITPIQGDANLAQIDDVLHLMRTFFAGAPAPAGLFGYGEQLSRDILEELRKQYYLELDALQDTLAAGYHAGFVLHLLLAGINPDAYDFAVVFAEPRTDTPNQLADLALKHQALGIPAEMVWRTAGYEPAEVLNQLAAEAATHDAYPTAHAEQEAVPADKPPAVAITPGNARGGESSTTITTRG
jgi:hypothetical protein